jgi:hypothetical protein
MRAGPQPPGDGALEHAQVPPHRDVSPAVDGREQLPVPEPIAEQRIRDVVGGQREALHLEQRLSIGKPWHRLVANAGDVNVVATHLQRTLMEGLVSLECARDRVHAVILR